MNAPDRLNTYDHHVVGWGCLPDERCELCGASARVYVARMGDYDYFPTCNECVPKGTQDRIAEVFAKAFGNKVKKG